MPIVCSDNYQWREAEYEQGCYSRTALYHENSKCMEIPIPQATWETAGVFEPYTPVTFGFWFNLDDVNDGSEVFVAGIYR